MIIIYIDNIYDSVCVVALPPFFILMLHIMGLSFALFFGSFFYYKIGSNYTVIKRNQIKML